MAGHVLLTKVNPKQSKMYFSFLHYIFFTRSTPQLWEDLFIKGFPVGINTLQSQLPSSTCATASFLLPTHY